MRVFLSDPLQEEKVILFNTLQICCIDRLVGNFGFSSSLSSTPVTELTGQPASGNFTLLHCTNQFNEGQVYCIYTFAHLYKFLLAVQSDGEDLLQ